MNLNELINTEVLEQNNISKPINVKLTGDEEMYVISWHNLSPEDLSAIRGFAKLIPTVYAEQVEFRKRTKFLDEEKYNTRNGYAKEGNVGHANTKALLDALTTKRNIKVEALDEVNYPDNLFAADFFLELYATEDVGPDTISDFVTWVMENRLKAYTEAVWQLQSYEFKERHPLHPDNKTVLIEGMNMLFLPESLLKEKGVMMLPNGTPLEVVKAVAMAQVSLLDVEQWEYIKTKQSATATLSRVINILWDKKSDHETVESLHGELPTTPAITEVISKIDIVSIVSAIFNN